jgi:hypothetical protein
MPLRDVDSLRDELPSRDLEPLRNVLPLRDVGPLRGVEPLDELLRLLLDLPIVEPRHHRLVILLNTDSNIFALIKQNP